MTKHADKSPVYAERISLFNMTDLLLVIPVVVIEVVSVLVWLVVTVVVLVDVSVLVSIVEISVDDPMIVSIV